MPKAGSRRMRVIGERASLQVFYFQSAVASSVVFLLLAMFVANVLLGFFDIYVLSFMAAGMLTIMIFLDALTLLTPKGLKTNLLGIIYVIILSSSVILSLFLPSLVQNEMTPVAYTFFYSLIYGGWNLSVYSEQKEMLEKKHPRITILLVERGFLFLIYAYMSVISFLVFKILASEGIQEKILLSLFIVSFGVQAFPYTLEYGKFRVYLRKTKKGRELVMKSRKDKWEPTVSQKYHMKLLWYLALPIGVFSLYAGLVSLYYFGLMVFNLERVFLGILAIGSGISILSYYWSRTGFYARLPAALSSPPRRDPTSQDVKERIRDLEKWCGLFLGSVFALVGLLRLTGVRAFAKYGSVEINDMTLVYIDIFWLLTILIVAETLLSILKTKRRADISEISRHVDHLYLFLWYFLAGLTGSYAYALGIPPIIDAIVVVAFLLTITVYRLYTLYVWR